MNRRKRLKTGFLFSTPTFLMGIGTVISLSGQNYSYNASESGQEADCIAINNDFAMVGQDINDSINEFKKSLK